jgi:hypothetical protein
MLFQAANAAYVVEAAIKNGDWELGRPLLNPGR